MEKQQEEFSNGVRTGECNGPDGFLSRTSGTLLPWWLAAYVCRVSSGFLGALSPEICLQREVENSSLWLMAGDSCPPPRAPKAIACLLTCGPGSVTHTDQVGLWPKVGKHGRTGPPLELDFFDTLILGREPHFLNLLLCLRLPHLLFRP